MERGALAGRRGKAGLGGGPWAAARWEHHYPAPSCLPWSGTQREGGWGGRPWPLSLQRSVHWLIAFNELQLVKGFEARKAEPERRGFFFLNHFIPWFEKQNLSGAESNSQGCQPPVVVTFFPPFQLQLNDEDYKMWKNWSPRRQWVWHLGRRQGEMVKGLWLEHW